MNNNMSLTMVYTRVAGIVLAAAGILGMLATTSQTGTVSLMGMDVNLTHNLLHLVAGVLAAGVGFGFIRAIAVRDITIVIASVFTLLGAIGIVSGDFDVLGLFQNINQAGSLFHLVIGAVGIMAWVVTRDEVIETA